MIFFLRFLCSLVVLGYSKCIYEQKGLPSLSGGGQVDGSPPASSLRMQGLKSNTNSPLRKPRVRRTYSEKMTSFFEKVEFFQH